MKSREKMSETKITKIFIEIFGHLGLGFILLSIWIDSLRWKLFFTGLFCFLMVFLYSLIILNSNDEDLK